MGGLLSSEPTPPPQYIQRSFIYPTIPEARPRPTTSVSNNPIRQYREVEQNTVRRVPSNHNQENLRASYRPRISSNRDAYAFDSKTNQFYTLIMDQCIREYRWISFSNEVKFVQLYEDSIEYNSIKNRFARCLRQEQPNVIKIEKVQNNILMGQYLLKKEEYRCKGIVFCEKDYYHGTKQNNVNRICCDNFDWRITNRNKFGKGVSFAPTSSYAIHYCDKNPNRPKVMIVAKVIIGRTCLGYENMPLPNEGSDASIKEDGKVLVKFYDNEYYPQYLIHFTANVIRHNNNNKRNTYRPLLK